MNLIKTTIILIALLFVFTGCKQQVPIKYSIQSLENYDKTKYYTNPQNIQLIADPYVLKDKDGTYYAYGTSDKISATGYMTWKSKDLINWEESGVVYMAGKDDWAKKDFWAPEVYLYNDEYYMFYTARDNKATKHLSIGVAKSDSPTGPFKDVTARPILDSLDYSTIDANLLFEDDKAYMYYVRDCSDNVVGSRHESHIYGVELNMNDFSISEPVLLAKPEQEWENNGDWVWNEGPFVIKRDNKYYLMYSANFYADRQYSLGYAVSDNPLGPFTKSETNPILFADETMKNISGTGHNSIVSSPDNTELYCVYHTHMYPQDPNHKREINIDKIIFDKDKIYINGPSRTPQPLPSGVSEYKLLNEHITKIEVDGGQNELNNLLNDGQIVFHQEDLDKSIQKQENMKVKLYLDKKIDITDLLIYTNNNQDVVKKVRFSNNEIIENIPSRDLESGEAVILTFDTKGVEWLEIEFSANSISVSEISILGK